jgi:hypothetical protein
MQVCWLVIHLDSGRGFIHKHYFAYWDNYVHFANLNSAMNKTCCSDYEEYKYNEKRE